MQLNWRPLVRLSGVTYKYRSVNLTIGRSVDFVVYIRSERNINPSELVVSSSKVCESSLSLPTSLFRSATQQRQAPMTAAPQNVSASDVPISRFSASLRAARSFRSEMMLETGGEALRMAWSAG